MALRFRVISADDHVQEPPDLWTARLSKKQFGDAIPRIAKQAGGTERWVIGGKVKADRRLASTGALSAERHTEPQRWDQVPRAAYDPAERLKLMDKDGVDVEVLYPSAMGMGGETLNAIADPALEAACAAAYNDWLLETWAKASPRFIPQCLLPVSTVDGARKELERSIARGHRGAVMASFPWRVKKGLPHIHDRAWDPLWASLQGLGVPICWHSGTDEDLMLEIYPGLLPPVSRAFESVRRPVSNAIAVANFVLGGVPERFPNLKVVFPSSSIDWVTFQIENTDHEWRTSMLVKENIPKPSEVFHRQCYVTTWFDRAGLNQRGYLGVDNILWQSEFPMETSTYPRSAELIRQNFAAVPEAERDKMLHGNAAALYKVQV